MKRFTASWRAPIICVFMLLSCNHAAYAQTKIPNISVAPDYQIPQPSDNQGDLSNSFAMIPNEQLAAQLKLQHQISIMQKLIARQSELKKLADIYEKMGLTFSEPPPPRALCEQIPVNTVCLSHYNDLYPESVGAVRAAYEAEIAELRKSLTRNNNELDDGVVDEKARAEAERKRKAALEAARRKQELAERKGRYQWTDIRCTNNNCMAVLVASRDESKRFTVRAQTRLPDGTLVEDISEEGIRINIKGDLVDVQGAPATDAPKSASTASQPQKMMPKAANNSTPENIQPDTGAVKTADTKAASTPDLETTPPQGSQASASPALAPSNLF